MGVLSVAKNGKTVLTVSPFFGLDLFFLFGMF
jgi:hypothetical protein